MRNGIDVSNFSLVPSAEQLAQLRADGHDFCIPGTQTGLDGKCYTQQQIDAFRGAGFEVPAVYVFLYWDGQDDRRVEDAKKYGLPVWLDCEWAVPHDNTPADMVARIQAAANQLGSQCAGIYTGSWWWVPNTSNSSAFAHLPLWHADYRPAPVPFETFHPYGGWTRPRVWQWSSAGIDGVTADLDVMEETPALVAGIGVHYTDGSSEEVWLPRMNVTLDGIGIRYTDGRIERLWPK